MASNEASVFSVSEFKCAICLQILIEPVVLPCKHEMCRVCFRKNVEEANFLCPMCRKRIASWTRKCMREGTLVDQSRWDVIQKLFPDKCLRRLNGEDDESEDESYQPPPKRVLAKSGELRKEYEQEMNKILQVHEEEEQASKKLIKNILEEEQALLQQQEKNDEDFARELSKELKNAQENKESDSKTVGNGLKSPNISSKTASKDLKRKKMNSKSPGRSYTLDRYFFPKEKQSGNSSKREPNNVLDGQQLHKSDYEMAMELQKQFDREGVTANKRDEYMLRTTTPDNYNEHAIPREKQKGTAGQLKNGQTTIVSKLIKVNGENIQTNKEKDKQTHSTGNEIRLLRDRTIITGQRKHDVGEESNHEL